MDEIPRIEVITMKFYLFVLSLALVAAPTRAQTPPRTDEQVLKAISKRMAIEIKSPEYFRSAPPETAWAAFEYLTANAQYGNLELAKQAGRAIAENPAIEKYVTEKITKIPNDFNTHNERVTFLVPLGDVPAPWSVRLLGHYLMDETPMTLPEELPDYSASPNQYLALGALSRLGFSDAPTKDRNPKMPPSVKEAWRTWWKANEDRVEQRIREINPGYYPPQPAATATPATPTPAVAGEYASTPAVGNTPKPTPSATPVAAVPARQSDWAIYAIGGLVALAALVAVGWAIRRR